jgi:hypothetical protein
MQQTRTVLKTYFEEANTPTDQNFSDLIDSCANVIDDHLTNTIQTLVIFNTPDPVDGITYGFKYNAETQTFTAIALP